MSNTTSKSIELRHEKPDAYLTARVSKGYKQLVNRVAREMNMDESKMIRYSVDRVLAEKADTIENK